MKSRSGINCKESVDLHEREKDYFTADEITAILTEAKKSRYGKRDYLLFLLMYRHGLRVSEAIVLKVSDFDLKYGRMKVARLKRGLSVEHPMEPDEVRAVKAHLGGRKEGWVFLSERGTPMTRQAINYLLNGVGGRLGFHIHPHMLRHSCGYYLTNSGASLRIIQDYLGHRWIGTTVRYTRTAAVRFEGLWRR